MFTSSNYQNETGDPFEEQLPENLSQVLKSSSFIIPEKYNGKDYPVDKTIFVWNKTNSSHQIFMYKGEVSIGQMINVSPYKHFWAQALGGIDAVPIQNKFTVNFQLYAPRTDNHESSDTSFDPSLFDLNEGYGTYGISWNKDNLVAIQRTGNVDNPDPETFYFRFSTSDVNWTWVLKLFCDKQLVGVLRSHEVIGESEIINGTGSVNRDEVPSYVGELKVCQKFTIIVVKSSNINVNTTKSILQTEKYQYSVMGAPSYITLGQTYALTIANSNKKQVVTDVVQTNTLMKAQPRLTTNPPVFSSRS